MNKQKQSDLISFLESLKRKHHINDDDCWYSCPASGECCNDALTNCNCGADDFNDKIDNKIKELNIPVVSGSLQSLQEWAKSEKDGQVEQIIVMTAFGNTIVCDLTSKSSIEEFCKWE